MKKHPSRSAQRGPVSEKKANYTPHENPIRSYAPEGHGAKHHVMTSAEVGNHLEPPGGEKATRNGGHEKAQLGERAGDHMWHCPGC